MRRAVVGLLALVSVPLVAAGSVQSVPAAADLATILQRVGNAVERYFARAQSLICTEVVSLQSLGYDLSPDSVPARRLTYELRVAWEPSPDGGAPEASAERRLLKIGSRAPSPKDKPGCVDPKEVSPEPLAFLLPSKQSESSFTLAGTTKVNGRPALMLDYRSREVGPISSKMTSEDCWSIELPGRQRGRIWLDAETQDVLRVDERLTGIFDVTLPSTKNHRERQTMTIDRLDTSTVYRPVTFEDPEETIMLPKQIDTVQVVRNSGSPRMRKTHVFSNYRRFITGGRIVQDD